MGQRIAVFGGSFNPPGVHHRAMAEALAGRFDQVVVIPCGPRPDKPVTNDVSPIFRAAMADMTFYGLERVTVELSDLEAETFTRNHALQERYGAFAEVWHVVDAGLVQGGGSGRSFIERTWERGPELWRECAFAVVVQPGAHPAPADLPPRHEVVEVDAHGSSAEIRDLVFHRRTVKGLVIPEVAQYMDRHGLYRTTHPSRTTCLPVHEIRPLIIADPHNPQAGELGRTLGFSEEQDPNLIVVIGGDGTLLRAIRSHWRRRLPFYGINAGHAGFLLNTTPPDRYLDQELVLEHLPLLRVEVVRPAGGVDEALAFNDAWVERASGQAAWLEVTVDSHRRLPHLVADGALMATAAGSTSYARAMGGSALPMNTPALVLVGSNVLRPVFFKPVVLPLQSRVAVHTLDPDKRPLRGFLDGVPQGEVHGLRARVSNIASVELAFDPLFDPAEKLAHIQFPLPPAGASGRRA